LELAATASDDFVVEPTIEVEPDAPAPAADFGLAPQVTPEEAAPEEAFIVDEPAAPEPVAAAEAGDVFLVEEAPPIAPMEEFLVEAEPAPQPPPPAAVARPAAPPTPAAPARPAPPAPPAAAAPAPPPRPAAPTEAPRPAPAPKPAPAAAPAPPRPAARSAAQYDVPEMAPGRERVAPSVGEAPRAAAAGARPPRKKAGPPIALYAGIGGAALAVLGAGGFYAMRALSAPRIQAVTPARVATGQLVTLSGSHFAPDAAGNALAIGGKPAQILKASPTQLEAQVPEIAVPPGKDTLVKVVLRVGDRETSPFEIALHHVPRIHGLSPDVAMPGEEIALEGTGWGQGAQVKFGALNAEVLQASATTLKVRVPAIEGGPGTGVPVTVLMGADASNAAPFIVGHLPLVTRVEPLSAAPGDMLTITGRGFQLQAQDNLVRIGGAHALLVSANGTELKVIVPRVPEGDAPVEVHARGLDGVGQASLKVPPPSENVEFRFVAEPLDDAQGHDHAILSTELGPAFVLSAAAGKSAAERALDAISKLNAAATALKASRDQDLEARGLDKSPAIGLTGKAESLFEAADEDVAAYDEDWTKLGAKSVPVTRSRLATWWGAVGKDLVLLLVRSERPHFAADLAGEGRVLGDVFQAARKATEVGVPRKLVVEQKPPVRDALRTLALRVPASVTGPASAADLASAVRLDGVWTGSEDENGRHKSVSVTFKGNGGSFAYEGGVTMSLPILSAEQQKGNVRFSIQFRGVVRRYLGRWDGKKLAGKISSDAQDKGDIGSFEITPAQ
jgi:hypothetical protein